MPSGSISPSSMNQEVDHEVRLESLCAVIEQIEFYYPGIVPEDK